MWEMRTLGRDMKKMSTGGIVMWEMITEGKVMWGNEYWKESDVRNE